jgi:nitroreductase
MIKDLILKNRSYRRFYQDKSIEIETLRELIDLARLSPSGANRQALRYILSNTKETNDKIFANIAWAGYLKDWNGPKEGEKPSAYIVMVKDTTVGPCMAQDEGIAGQSILLGAVEKGLGGCFIANINKKKLALELSLEDKYEILLVMALGTPKEEVVIEKMDTSGDVKYWRDDNEVHHVPKRTLDEIIL